MVFSTIMVVGGGLALYFGAEWLVRGAAGLARSFGVRPMIVGLTVVAYGTSAPELVVSCGAALEGRSAMALGNVLGSNIANLGLILGVTALIAPPRVERGLIMRELPVLLLSASALPIFLLDGNVSRLEALVLLSAALLFSWFLVRTGNKPISPSDGDIIDLETGADESRMSRKRLGLVAVVGLGVLLAGGKAFVDGAVQLALIAGLSERVVGLTIVAMGTSMPEMAASVLAALRGHPAIAVGNVIGSNIFNVLMVLGSTALVSPVEGTLTEFYFDVGMLTILTVLGVVFLRTERVISRWEGALLLGIYAAFLAALAT